MISEVSAACLFAGGAHDESPTATTDDPTAGAYALDRGLALHPPPLDRQHTAMSVLEVLIAVGLRYNKAQGALRQSGDSVLVTAGGSERAHALWVANSNGDARIR